MVIKATADLRLMNHYGLRQLDTLSEKENAALSSSSFLRLIGRALAP